MKLSEKIFYYRKKAGKSQEEFAEQIGVSRQAVSKWETGESEPEIAKLKTLAAVFGVTVDFLLSEEEPPEERAEAQSQVKTETSREAGAASGRSWIDLAPKMVGKLFRRFGWLAGVYVAVIGVFILLIGGLATFVSNGMVNSFNASVESMYGSFGTSFGDPFGASLPQVTAYNPVGIVGGVILLIGLILVIGGVILAVWLKKKGSK